jgi:hypothetical protein
MSSEAERILHEAVKLANSVQDQYFEFGALLYELKENDYYKLIDNKKYYSDNHKKWKLFCEENLPVSYRTAQYWLSIYRYFTDMGVTKERLQSVGWSKAKELIDITEDTNVLEKALKVAESGSIQQLQAYIATIEKKSEKVGEDERETLKSYQFNFKLYEASGETVDQILDKVAETTGGDKNQALFKIMIEWYQQQSEIQLVDPLDAYKVEDEEERVELIA